MYLHFFVISYLLTVYFSIHCRSFYDAC